MLPFHTLAFRLQARDNGFKHNGAGQSQRKILDNSFCQFVVRGVDGLAEPFGFLPQVSKFFHIVSVHPYEFSNHFIQFDASALDSVPSGQQLIIESLGLRFVGFDVLLQRVQFFMGATNHTLCPPGARIVVQIGDK